MCGFVVRRSNNLDRKNLETATKTLTHRGPDQRAIQLDEKQQTGLGVQRLSVVDPDGGNQPMTRGDSTLVFNGEIYNYPVLKTRLKQSGYDFETDSDTEVLLQAYRAWGTDCLNELEGMFAFVIRDTQKDRLLLARDRMGQKPLYYSDTQDGFLAASEIQAILAFRSVSRTLNHRALPLYLGLQYIPSPRSGYRDIRKLPPAHFAIVEDESVGHKERYWQPEHEVDHRKNREDAKNELREALSESVQRRRRSDTSIGLFLSGGLDSSILAGLLARRVPTSLKTFTLDYDDADPCERTSARRVAEVFDTDHTEVHVEPEIDSLLPEIIKHHGEPFADSSILAQHWLAREAGKSITVALGGDGADELFGGYGLYRNMRVYEQARRWLPDALKGLLHEGARRVSHRVQSRTGWSKALLLLRGLRREPGEWYYRMMNYFQPEGMDRLFRDSPNVDDQAPMEFCRKQFERLGTGLSATRRAMAFDVETYLPGDILAKVDTATMMNSVEGRSPYLDSAVVNLASSLPLKHQTNGKWGNKSLLRETFSDMIPRKILERPKQGFGIPRARWLRGRWREYASRVLKSDRNDGFFELFNRAEVQRLFDEHQTEDRNHAGRLWALMVLRIWLRVGNVRL